MYLVSYKGAFGFIKPWSAVRDDLTQSQPFLTPSIIEGMNQKLGTSSILRHKVSYGSIAVQQEVTQAKDFVVSRQKGTKFKTAARKKGILSRGVLINPVLHLLFESEDDASLAFSQHLCLCRNEDIVFPFQKLEIQQADFEQLDGFELLFVDANTADSLMVGFNRYRNNEPMYGVIA